MAKLVELADVVAAQAAKGRLVGLVTIARQQHEHDLAGELALPFGEMFFLRHRRDDDRGGHRSVGRRRPGNRNGGQRERARRDHTCADRQDFPSAAEFKAIAADIGQAPAFELSDRPGFGPAHGGRIGQAWTDTVGHFLCRLHHLAAIIAFVDDAIGVVAALPGRRHGQTCCADQQRRHQTPVHERVPFISSVVSDETGCTMARARLQAWMWPNRRGKAQ